MGIQLSTPNFVPNGQLLLAPELVDIIVDRLSGWDLCAARGVCREWMMYVHDSGRLSEKMAIRIEDNKSFLEDLASSPLPPMWSAFTLSGLDFNRDVDGFWRLYTDHITRLEFRDCILPRGCYRDLGLGGLNTACPNLKHLGLVSMQKYFMMGAAFVDLQDKLCMENLESLDFSSNMYLSDKTMFMFLLKTRKLKSLNLTGTRLTFFKAVHKRFYPNGTPSQCISVDYDENILAFRTLVSDFLQTPIGSRMREIIFKDTQITNDAINLISNPAEFSWESVDFLQCVELKPKDYKNFIASQSQTLKKLVLERIDKKNSSIVDIFDSSSIPNLEYLSLQECHQPTSSLFLRGMPNLKCLILEGCDNVEVTYEDLFSVPNLEVLNLNKMRFNWEPALKTVLPKLNKITSLDLQECSWVTDELIQIVIKFLRRLRRLNISRTSVSDAGVAAVNCDLETEPHHLSLSQLHDLAYLDLSHCVCLGDRTWCSALQLPLLVHLNLSGCTQLTAQALQIITKGCPSLEYLSILRCGTQITSELHLVRNIQESLLRLRQFIIQPVAEDEEDTPSVKKRKVAKNLRNPKLQLLDFYETAKQDMLHRRTQLQAESSALRKELEQLEHREKRLETKLHAMKQKEAEEDDSD